MEKNLFGLLLSKIICTAVGIYVPSSLLQCLMPHNHTEIEAENYS